ncbi:Uncharacterised protein [Mycobacterium tuberculosis]|nr:Uncharacterised protein [Mycobacterium tuberculosis]
MPAGGSFVVDPGDDERSRFVVAVAHNYVLNRIGHHHISWFSASLLNSAAISRSRPLAACW